MSSNPYEASETISSGAVSNRRSYVILGLVMCLAAAGHFNRVSISVAGSEKIIQTESSAEDTQSWLPKSGISATQMGTVYTSFLVLYTTFMIPGGWLIDRIGAKWALALMCLGSAVFTVLTGVVGLIWREPAVLWGGLLLVRSLMGITNAPLHPASARLVTSWLPPAATIVGNGMVTFAACLGMGLVYVAFGKLIDEFGWPVSFLITGGITFALALVWIVLAEDRQSPQLATASTHDGTAENLWTLLANPTLLSLTVSYAAVGYFQYLFFYWMEFYFEKILTLDKETSRWLSTAMVVAMGIGMVVGGRLADICSSRGGKHAHRLVPVCCLVLSAVLVLIAVLSDNNYLKIGLFLMSMAAVGGTEGSYWTQSVALGRSRGGTSASIMNTGGNVGGLLAPLVTPYIADRLGWQYGMGMASAVCIVGAALWYWIELPQGKTQSDRGT